MRMCLQYVSRKSSLRRLLGRYELDQGFICFFRDQFFRVNVLLVGVCWVCGPAAEHCSRCAVAVVVLVFHFSVGLLCWHGFVSSKVVRNRLGESVRGDGTERVLEYFV